MRPEDLSRPGYDDAWFAAASPELRQTVLNCRHKLGGLWRFVEREDGSEPGNLHFRCTDVAQLRAVLEASPSFRCPPEKGGRWEASERTFAPSLHIKHFPGWPEDKLQAHVDPVAAFLPWRWWLLPVVPLAQFVRHLVHYHGYRDAFDVARRLAKAGAPEWLLSEPTKAAPRP